MTNGAVIGFAIRVADVDIVALNLRGNGSATTYCFSSAVSFIFRYFSFLLLQIF